MAKIFVVSADHRALRLHRGGQDIHIRMVPGGKHCDKSVSSGWKVATFRRRTSRGGAADAEREDLPAHSNLRFLVGVAVFFLPRADTLVPLPAGAGSDVHSVFDGVVVWIGRANTAAGHFDAFGGDMGCDRFG